MFGNMMEMMGKLKGLQEKFSEMKERLDSEAFIATSKDKKLRIHITHWATVKDVEIVEAYDDKEELQDVLVLTLNASLNRIKDNLEKEIQKTAQENMPQLPGMKF